MLTRNQPAGTQVLTVNDTTQGEVLAWAAALQVQSTDPLAAAITAAAYHPIGAIGVRDELRPQDKPKWCSGCVSVIP